MVNNTKVGEKVKEKSYLEGISSNGFFCLQDFLEAQLHDGLFSIMRLSFFYLCLCTPDPVIRGCTLQSVRGVFLWIMKLKQVMV